MSKKLDQATQTLKTPRSRRSNGNGLSSTTIMDVAREAGVSYATVSRVGNNKEYVKSDTRERVLKAITSLGYVVNQQARSLAGGRSYAVGLLVRDLGSSYMGEIVKGIDDALSAAQYNLMLYTTHRRKIKERIYVNNLIQGMTDGLLLVLPENLEAYLETLDQTHFPYVLIDHQGLDERTPVVITTNWQGGYDATRYLIELGHRRIGFITGMLDMLSSQDRLSGYQAALRDHGLPVDPQLVYEGTFYQPGGYSGAQSLLGLPEPPTAIFASNDVMAFGVMEAVRDAGLRIPSDISVIGFDNIAQASQVAPPLTTVAQPLEQLGREAVRMLLVRMNNPEQPIERSILPTTLIIRQSCDVPRNV